MSIGFFILPTFSTGRPLFFNEPCPDAAYDDKPSGYYVRAGAGLPPFAYEQDCALWAEHQDRVRVVEYMTNAGVSVPAIRLEGDSPNRTGGAEIIRPLVNPTTWASGQGIREIVNFTLSDEVTAEPYCVFELRGALDLGDLKNEGFAALTVAVRKNSFKVKYYLDEDAQGGGGRFETIYGYTFDYGAWYQLSMRLLPVPSVENTWDLKVRVSKIGDPDCKIVFHPAAELRPNHIKSLEAVAIGDEQQNIQSGGVTYLSLDEDIAIPDRTTPTAKS